MSKKTLVLGLALSGSVLGLMWAGPARAQSALAQQEADQEKAAQQGTATSSTDAGTAKPATAKAKPTAAKPDATTAPATKPTAVKASDAATVKPGAKPTAAKSDAATAPATKPDATAAPATKAAATAPKASTATTKPVTPTSTAAKPAAAKKAPAKPVVYVGDGLSSAGTSAAPGASANAKPQNRDVVKAFEQSCPDVTLTEQKAKAGYDVSLEREPGSKGVKTVFGLTNVVHKTNRIEVTSKSGKEVFSETGHSTNQLVKHACAAMAPPPTKVAKN